jgi:phosphatidate cytidylyltransferase
MLRARIITAAVLLLLITPVLFWTSSAWVDAGMLVICALGAREWSKLAGLSHQAACWCGLLCAGLIAALWWIVEPSTIVYVGLISLIFWLWVALRWLPLGVPGFFSRARRFMVILGLCILLAVWEGAHAAMSLGPWFFISVMSVVWISDIAAYFSGHAFGKHKLAPSISPGKTWEGVIGAWICTALLAVYLAQADFAQHVPHFYSMLFQRAGWWGGLAVITVLVALGIVGDLFESQLKRRAGVKDSGRLLPGHGGVLDRIDALLPTLPAAMLFEYLTR